MKMTTVISGIRKKDRIIVIDVYMTDTICRNCQNLIYTNDYLCQLGLNKRNDGYLNRKIINKCDFYAKQKSLNLKHK